MARIAGVDLPRNKRVEVALTYLFGIGRPLSNQILGRAGIDKNKKSDDLTDDEVVKLRQVIDQNLKVEGDLRRDIAMNIKRHMDLGTYRGLRHRRNLPVHGQRTHSNARTRKGPRRAIAGKKKTPQKT
jgi:small subunit ribosomal protein S13